MSRVYEVWHSQNRDTKEITKFFISDATVQEHAAGLDRTVATFPVSKFADEARQRTRAEQFCAFLNGHFKYDVTEKGLAHDEAVAERNAHRKEQQRIDALERNEAAVAQAKKVAHDALENAMSRAAKHIPGVPEQEKHAKRGWLSRLRGETK